LSHEILNSAPYAYLDDAPLEERRSRAVQLRRTLDPGDAASLGALDRDAIAEVVAQATPDLRSADELHDLLLTLVLLAALLAPWISPQDPYDLARLELLDSRLPPLAHSAAGAMHWLGTDDQGRDMLSAILYGLRTSVAVGFASTILGLAIGVSLGLAAAWFGGWLDALLPFMPSARGQKRGNSGVYLQDRYEIQVLDSFGLKGEANECGAIYTKTKPAVHMCYPPLIWQTYDVDFTSAKFDSGKKIKNAVTTVKHNGVLIHEQVQIDGPTGRGKPETPAGGPIHLQDHGNPVRYRNIWIRRL